MLHSQKMCSRTQTSSFYIFVWVNILLLMSAVIIPVESSNGTVSNANETTTMSTLSMTNSGTETSTPITVTVDSDMKTTAATMTTADVAATTTLPESDSDLYQASTMTTTLLPSTVATGDAVNTNVSTVVPVTTEAAIVSTSPGGSTAVTQSDVVSLTTDTLLTRSQTSATPLTQTAGASQEMTNTTSTATTLSIPKTTSTTTEALTTVSTMSPTTASSNITMSQTATVSTSVLVTTLSSITTSPKTASSTGTTATTTLSMKSTTTATTSIPSTTTTTSTTSTTAISTTTTSPPTDPAIFTTSTEATPTTSTIQSTPTTPSTTTTPTTATPTTTPSTTTETPSTTTTTPITETPTIETPSTTTTTPTTETPTTETPSTTTTTPTTETPTTETPSTTTETPSTTTTIPSTKTTPSTTTTTPSMTTTTPATTTTTDSSTPSGERTESSSSQMFTSTPSSTTTRNGTLILPQTGMPPELLAVTISVPLAVILVGVITAVVLYVFCCKRRGYRDPIRKPGRHIGRETSIETITNPADAEEGTSEVAIQYEVMYPYKAQEEDQLSLSPGDVIDVLELEDSGWWLGKLGNKQGWFPGNYVEATKSNRESRGFSNYGFTGLTGETFGKEKPKQSATLDNQYGSVNESTIFLESEKYYNVLHPYHAAEFGELELSEGDVIVVKAVDRQQEWMWGTLDVSGEEGWFPSNYVQEVDEGDDTLDAESEKAVEAPPVYAYAYEQLRKNKDGTENIIGIEHQALFEYHSEEPGDLTFDKGDLIVVTEIMDNGWWFGCHGNRQGWFPGSYLEIIDQDQDVPRNSDYQYVQLNIGAGGADQQTDHADDHRVSTATYMEFIASDFPPTGQALSSDAAATTNSTLQAPSVDIAKSSTLKRKPRRPAPPAPKVSKTASSKPPGSSGLTTFSPPASQVVKREKPKLPKINVVSSKGNKSVEMTELQSPVSATSKKSFDISSPELQSPVSATSKKSFDISGPQLISSTADLEAHRIKTIKKRQEKPAVPTRWVIPRMVKVPRKTLAQNSADKARPVHRAPPPRPQPPDPEKIKQTVTGQHLQMPQPTPERNIGKENVLKPLETQGNSPNVGNVNSKQTPKFLQTPNKEDTSQVTSVKFGVQPEVKASSRQDNIHPTNMRNVGAIPGGKQGSEDKPQTFSPAGLGGKTGSQDNSQPFHVLPTSGLSSKPAPPNKPIATIKPVRKNDEGGSSHLSELESILAKRKKSEGTSGAQDGGASLSVPPSAGVNSNKPAVPKAKPSLPVKPKLRDTPGKGNDMDFTQKEIDHSSSSGQLSERPTPQPKPRTKLGQGQENGSKINEPVKPKPRTTLLQGNRTVPKLGERSQSESDTLFGYSTTPGIGGNKSLGQQRPPRPGERLRTRSVDGAIDVPSKVESKVFPPLKVGASAIRQRPNRPPPPRLTKIWSKEDNED